MNPVDAAHARLIESLRGLDLAMRQLAEPSPPPPTPAELRDALRLAAQHAAEPLQSLRNAAPPAAQGEGPRRPQTPLRRLQERIARVMAVVQLPHRLLNDGYSVLATLENLPYPALPAMALGSVYVGIPHAHSHPPSWVPPAPPVPLPSIGAALIGGATNVLINYRPAVRAGDMVVAPTCGGIAPFGEVYVGSSKVFIGGNRAARMGDIVLACAPGGGHASVVGAAMATIGVAVGAISVGADLEDAEEEARAGETEMASAHRLSAAVGAASTALGAVAGAVGMVAGAVRDPAITPAIGALLGPPSTVLIGGFPQPDVPDPTAAVLGLVERNVRKWRRSRSMRDAREGFAEQQRRAGLTACPPRG